MQALGKGEEVARQGFESGSVPSMEKKIKISQWEGRWAP